MIVDCHGHYTVLPPAHDAWRAAQIAAFAAREPAPPYPAITDDAIRETIEANQMRLIRERGMDMTIFSPRASAMAPTPRRIPRQGRRARFQLEMIADGCTAHGPAPSRRSADRRTRPGGVRILPP